jgi:hypothetical protein
VKVACRISEKLIFPHIIQINSHKQKVSAVIGTRVEQEEQQFDTYCALTDIKVQPEIVSPKTAKYLDCTTST